MLFSQRRISTKASLLLGGCLSIRSMYFTPLFFRFFQEKILVTYCLAHRCNQIFVISCTVKCVAGLNYNFGFEQKFNSSKIVVVSSLFKSTTKILSLCLVILCFKLLMTVSFCFDTSAVEGLFPSVVLKLCCKEVLQRLPSPAQYQLF